VVKFSTRVNDLYARALIVATATTIAQSTAHAIFILALRTKYVAFSLCNAWPWSFKDQNHDVGKMSEFISSKLIRYAFPLLANLL